MKAGGGGPGRQRDVLRWQPGQGCHHQATLELLHNCGGSGGVQGGGGGCPGGEGCVPHETCNCLGPERDGSSAMQHGAGRICSRIPSAAPAASSQQPATLISVTQKTFTCEKLSWILRPSSDSAADTSSGPGAAVWPGAGGGRQKPAQSYSDAGGAAG